MQITAIDVLLKAATIDAIASLVAGTCELVDPDSVHPVSLTAPRELDSDTVVQFARLILDPTSWNFAKKKCLPRQTAVVRMRGAKGNVTVSLGFSCVGWIITASAERRGGFFDPVQHHVREMLKKVFPEFASPDHRSLWRSGIINTLKTERMDTGA